MVNTNYHKSINKTLISRNYFDGLQKMLLLCNSYHKYTEFAIGTLIGFRKSMTNTRSIFELLTMVIHNAVAVMQNRAWQIGQKIEEAVVKNGVNNTNRKTIWWAD
jgi:hypothetical protein